MTMTLLGAKHEWTPGSLPVNRPVYREITLPSQVEYRWTDQTVSPPVQNRTIARPDSVTRHVEANDLLVWNDYREAWGFIPADHADRWLNPRAWEPKATFAIAEGEAQEYLMATVEMNGAAHRAAVGA